MFIPACFGTYRLVESFVFSFGGRKNGEYLEGPWRKGGKDAIKLEDIEDNHSKLLIPLPQVLDVI